MKRKRSTSVERAMRALNPVSEDADRHMATQQETEAALESLKATAGRQPHAHAPDSASRARKPVLAFAAAGALLVAGLAVALSPWDRTAPAIDQAMASVAANAGESPPLDHQTGEVRYLRMLSAHHDTAVSSGEAWSTTEPEISEHWIAPDGTGRARVTSLGQRFASADDRAAWIAAGRPHLGPIGPAFEVAERRRPRDGALLSPIPGVPLQELPTEPAELRAELEASAAGMNGSAPLPAKALALAAGILRDPAASGKLREATYLALADLEGIELLGSRKDPIGRPGEAIGVESRYSGGLTEFALVYHPGSGEALATTETGLEHADWVGMDPPFLITAEIYLAQGMSNDSRSLPPGVPALGKERAGRLADLLLTTPVGGDDEGSGR